MYYHLQLRPQRLYFHSINHFLFSSFINSLLSRLYNTISDIRRLLLQNNTTNINAMAAFAFTSCPETVSFGRSGYNKNGGNDDDRRNFGRSGYNKGGDNEDDRTLFGRSGYNKDGDNDDERRNSGRSGYN